MGLGFQIARTAFRGLRVLDAPAMLADVKFAGLRRRYYERYWIKVAQELGATYARWDFGFGRLTRNGTTVIVRGPHVRLDDPLTLDLMGNKLLTYQLLAEQGFEVPRHVRFTLRNMTPALGLLKDSGRPLVVKPVSGTGGGRGVTTGITSVAALRMAAISASRFDLTLMAEEQIEGHSYRLLFLDGELIDAIRRDPPRVTGDGRRSISALAAAETQNRLAAGAATALSPLQIDRDARLYLASQGLSPRSVPAAGETVIVKRAVNQNTRTENHVVRTQVHPATIAACSRLVTRLGVRLAGVDILAHDIGRSLGKGNGLVGEINTTPGLHHHDLVLAAADGPSVGARLAEFLFAQAEAAMTKTAVPVSHLRVAAG